MVVLTKSEYQKLVLNPHIRGARYFLTLALTKRRGSLKVKTFQNTTNSKFKRTEDINYLAPNIQM